jgi:hypothetical protein
MISQECLSRGWQHHALAQGAQHFLLFCAAASSTTSVVPVASLLVNILVCGIEIVGALFEVRMKVNDGRFDPY